MLDGIVGGRRDSASGCDPPVPQDVAGTLCAAVRRAPRASRHPEPGAQQGRAARPRPCGTRCSGDSRPSSLALSLCLSVSRPSFPPARLPPSAVRSAAKKFGGGNGHHDAHPELPEQAPQAHWAIASSDSRIAHPREAAARKAPADCTVHASLPHPVRVFPQSSHVRPVRATAGAASMEARRYCSRHAGGPGQVARRNPVSRAAQTPYLGLGFCSTLRSAVAVSLGRALSQARSRRSRPRV